MELHLSTRVCFCFLLSLSILLPTVQGEQPEVKLVDERPYLLIGSTWKPICGHYFWDNNVGASIFCKKLGYPFGGTIEAERNSYNEDAFYVGGCRSNDITDLENGCTKPNLVAPHDCKKGRPVSIKIKCTGSEIPSCPEYVNGDGYGGTETKINFSPRTENGCQKACKAQHPTSIGVTQTHDGTSECFCEFGKPLLGGNKSKYKTCLFLKTGGWEDLWWQQVVDTGMEENCLKDCGGKGGPCDTGVCGPNAFCCKEGSGECPPAAEKASPTEHTCVTQSGPWVENKGNEDCFGSCGHKGGACPSFCDPDGFCCRRGVDDCPAEAAAASPQYSLVPIASPHHTYRCVMPLDLWLRNTMVTSEENRRPGYRRPRRRGRRSLGTIEENREENPTFTTEGTPASTSGYLGLPPTWEDDEGGDDDL